MIFGVPFLDPDTNWRSQATLQHFLLLGVLLTLLLSLFFSPRQAFALALLIGALWELAQWDTCRWIPSCHVAGVTSPFLPGYGFGLMDLAADVLGASVVLVPRLLLHG